MSKIPQELLIKNDQMKKLIDERIAEEYGAVSDRQRDVIGTFMTEGWSLCLMHTLRPALDLAMVLMQSIEMVRKNVGEDGTLSLHREAMESIECLCVQIVGEPEAWQRDEIVDAVQVLLEPEERMAQHLRLGDVFTYTGAFTHYCVTQEPVVCSEMLDRVKLEARNRGSDRKHVVKIRLKTEQICEVIEKRA